MKLSNKKNLPITSFITYSNADIDKFTILKDNKDKIGIYRWVNLDTGEVLSFVSIRKAAEFLGVHQSSIAKSIQLKGFFR